jgi:hypothetical protein
MRILLDECAPRPLKRELADYEIRTVVEMGWSGKKNVEVPESLLDSAAQSRRGEIFSLPSNLTYHSDSQQAVHVAEYYSAFTGTPPQ